MRVSPRQGELVRERFGFFLFAMFVCSLVWIINSSASRVGRPITDQRPAPQMGDKSKCTSCSPLGNQEIYIPLIDLPESQGGELVFNSRSPERMSVTPVFYTRNGERIVGDPVEIRSAEIRYVNIKDLLPARYRHRRDWGGFALTYYGTNREMWSQFRFLGVNGGGNIDEFFTVKDESRSALFEGAWWLPEKSEAVIALGNISDAATSVAVSFGNGHTRNVNLPPHATEVVKEQYRDEGSASVELKVTGPVGSVVPAGLITTKDGSFNSVIRFYDPTKAKQPNLYANGFRLKGTTPHMVLKNTTQSSIAVLPRIIPLAGTTGTLTLSQVSLSAYEAKEVDLSELRQATTGRGDLDVVSLEVTNWAAPGSVIGSLYGTNNRTGIDYDVPLRDSGPIRSMTGAYPWKIDRDYKSIAYVTNITDEQAEFVVELAYEGGKFTLGPRKLQPRETAVFDLEQIRNDRARDILGHMLPSNVSQGQFKWAVRGVTNGNIVLIGRTEMVSRHQNVSSSYSCPMDCGPVYECQVDYPLFIDVGNAEPASATEMASWNYGYTMGPYPVSASWSVDEPVASFDPSEASETAVNGVTNGQANLTGFVGYFDRYDWDGLNCVFLGTVALLGGGQTQVAPPPHHLYVVSDVTSEWCTGGGPTSLLRVITYQAVDQYNNPVTRPVSIGERFFALNDHTCGAGAPQPSSCHVISNGLFTDTLLAGCTPVGGSCGYDVLNEIVYCRSLAVPQPIGSLNEQVHANEITVNGNSTSLQGTYIYP